MAGLETMGEKVQRLRSAAGLSQAQLAAAAGVPLGTLRNWEQDRRIPLLDTAARVARALAVSLDQLAPEPAPGDRPKPPPPRRPRGRPRKEK